MQGDGCSFYDTPQSMAREAGNYFEHSVFSGGEMHFLIRAKKAKKATDWTDSSEILGDNFFFDLE